MQDFTRDVDKLEATIRRELDIRIAAIEAQILSLSEKLSGIEKNMDSRFDKLEDAATERRNWVTRYLVGVVISFIFGSGAIGMIQFIFSLLRR